jgi:antitoxin component of MazEF toxin-antitoxin module
MFTKIYIVHTVSKSMMKKIKVWGGSRAILFSKEDCELWDLQEGDFVDIDIKKDIDWKTLRRRVVSN